MHVQIVLFDGFDLMDALAPYEVFTAAEMFSGGAATVQLVSAEGARTSGLDVALYLIERELGPRIAHAVEKLFEYERRGTVWQSRGLAPPFPEPMDS